MTPDRVEQDGVVVPDGWVIMPARPTNEMLDAGMGERLSYESNGGYCSVFSIYAAMLAAAPAPEAQAPAAEGSHPKSVYDLIGAPQRGVTFHCTLPGTYTPIPTGLETPQPEALGELPEPSRIVVDWLDADHRIVNLYTADQMRAYALASRPRMDEALLSDLDDYLDGCPDPSAVPKWFVNASSRLLWRCRAALNAALGEQHG